MQDVVDICKLRTEAKLRCSSCIFYEEKIEDCPYEEDIRMYRALVKGHKGKDFKF